MPTPKRTVLAAFVVLVFVAYQYMSATSYWRQSSGLFGGGGGRHSATRWQSADGSVDCLRSFCVWNHTTGDFVPYTHPNPERAAASAELRANGPNAIAMLPAKEPSDRARGFDFARRNAVYRERSENWWREPAIERVLARATQSERDNSLYAVPDSVYKQSNTKASPNYESGGDLPLVWSMYRPLWNCLDEDRIGDPMDGGKWICAPRGMPKTDCIVYSYGSNLQFDFEAAIHAGSPQCEIHIFDPTVNPASDRSKVVPEYVTYHYVGLTHESNPEGTGVVSSDLGLLESITDTMIRLGHTHVDLLKVDVEGYEWSWMSTLHPNVLARFDELLIELHFHGLVKTRKFFDKVFAAGYRIFHNEPNQFAGDRSCNEYALIRVAASDEETAPAPTDKAASFVPRPTEPIEA